LPVSIGKPHGGIAKKIGLAAGKLDQPLLRHRVRFDGAVGTDVAERHSALRQRTTNQQTAVAIERLALRAQEAHPMTPRLIDDAVEPGTKFGPPRHGLVVGDAVAVELGIARTAAEFIAKLEIGEAVGRESCASGLLENHGHQRENGTERTSMTALTLESLSSVMKRSAGRLE
jgi:hypothetical protein